MSKDVKDYREIQEIQDSVSRYWNLSNEIYPALSDINKENTGGNKVWLETNLFKKIFKLIGHANFLVKCIELLFELIACLLVELRNAKSEAYKEFAEKLKEEARIEDDDYSPNGERSIIEVDDIDNLLIELENKNNDRN